MHSITFEFECGLAHTEPDSVYSSVLAYCAYRILFLFTRSCNVWQYILNLSTHFPRCYVPIQIFRVWHNFASAQWQMCFRTSNRLCVTQQFFVTEKPISAVFSSPTYANRLLNSTYTYCTVLHWPQKCNSIRYSLSHSKNQNNEKSHEKSVRVDLFTHLQGFVSYESVFWNLFCGLTSRLVLAVRQTDTHTHTCTLWLWLGLYQRLYSTRLWKWEIKAD